MKKLICLLCLCLMLNSMAALAEDAYSEDNGAEEYVDFGDDREDEADESDADGDDEADESDANDDEDDETDESDSDDEDEDEAEDAEEDDAARDGDNPATDESADADAEALEDAPLADVDEEEPEDAIPENAQAWFSGDDGVFGGSLREVLGQVSGGETVYLRVRGPINIGGLSVDLIRSLDFEPDSAVFDDDCYVGLYVTDPEGDDPLALDDVDIDGDTADIWFRVETEPATPRDDDDGDEDDGDEDDDVESDVWRIDVDPDGFEADEWVNEPPVFTLSGIPEGMDWSYAAIIYDDRVMPLSGDTYIPSSDGVYTLRFVILDEIGDFISVSDQIPVRFDWTAPKVSIATAKDEDYSLDITATDALSGVAMLSVDGGRSWEDMENGETLRYWADEKTTLAAGKIQVMDAAGNIYKSEKAYELTALKSEETSAGSAKSASGSAGSSGGSSSSSKKSSSGTSSHASADDEEDDDTPSLWLYTSPMPQLYIDGLPKDMTLSLEIADEAGKRSTAIGFTSHWTRWLYGGDTWLTDAEDADTLLLEAHVDMDVAEAFDCAWRFNGELLRELSSEGINYLVLRVGDNLCVLSTEGFTGGTKYTELKMQGVSTRKFNYTVTMKVNRDPAHFSALTESDFSEECDLSVRASVEGVTYELSESERSPMYYYDVYLGPEDMLTRPFGTYA